MIYSIPTEKIILAPQSYVSTLSYNIGDWLNFFEKTGSCFSFKIKKKRKIKSKREVYEYIIG